VPEIGLLRLQWLEGIKKRPRACRTHNRRNHQSLELRREPYHQFISRSGRKPSASHRGND
jgi:hypothetical protein